MSETFVIVGAGLAGSSAAITLRERGFEGRIVLLGCEARLPYDRPPLSKAGIRDEHAAARTELRSADAYRQQEIEVHLGSTIDRLDAESQTVLLAGGGDVHYDRLLLATGGRARRLDIHSEDAPGVYYLRTADDAERIRARALQATRAIVVGMGLIGSEVAASLRQLGLEVTALDPLREPLARALGPAVGNTVHDVHRSHGVELRAGEGVVAIEVDGKGVTNVVTDRGSRLACDLAVIGIGMKPNVEIATAAGIAVDGGVLVDQYCRTSLPRVYAAGDIALHQDPQTSRYVRVEHWGNAMKGGQAAARSMLGEEAPYSPDGWFWSDQYDVNVQCVGLLNDYDQVVVRGSLDERRAVVFYLRERRVVAAVALNQGRDLRRAADLIRAGALVQADSLSDPGADLREIAAART